MVVVPDPIPKSGSGKLHDQGTRKAPASGDPRSEAGRNAARSDCWNPMGAVQVWSPRPACFRL